MKCAVKDCTKEFSVIYESHLPVKDQPVMICIGHYVLAFDSLVSQDPVKGKRCQGEENHIVFNGGCKL